MKLQVHLTSFVKGLYISRVLRHIPHLTSVLMDTSSVLLVYFNKVNRFNLLLSIDRQLRRHYDCVVM